MLMQKERDLVVEYGKKMSSAGLSKGTSGNISAFNRELGYMAISPSGIGYFETLPEDVVIMDINGNVVEGDRKPSSEYDLHLSFYRAKPEANAVVHTHSTYCTTFACLRLPIDAIHYVIGTAGSDVINCAEYATYGTPELAHNAISACGEARAVLLANHGLVVTGPNLPKAFSLAENMEFIAEMQYRAMCVGKPAVLDHEEMVRVMDKFKTHGQPKKSVDDTPRVY